MRLTLAILAALTMSLTACGGDVDTEILDDGGHTALYWAVTRGHSDIAAAIEAASGEG